MSDDKVEVKESDMEEAEQSVVVAVVREAQRLYNINKNMVHLSFHPSFYPHNEDEHKNSKISFHEFQRDVAAYIKEELDKQLSPTWHVICGKCFGSRVSYEMGHFLLLKCNRVNVMIFKCGY